MKKIAIYTASIASVGVIAATGIGIASAATTKNTNVGTSGIPRTVYMQERQTAVAAVLGTSSANVQTAHKNHTISQLIASAGLTRKTFEQKTKAELTTDLEAKGYTQDQITIAMQHKHIHALEHKNKPAKESATSTN